MAGRTGLAKGEFEKEMESITAISGRSDYLRTFWTARKRIACLEKGRSSSRKEGGARTVLRTIEHLDAAYGPVASCEEGGNFYRGALRKKKRKKNGRRF